MIVFFSATATTIRRCNTDSAIDGPLLFGNLSPMRTQLTPILSFMALGAAAAGIAGCGSGGGLSTGSLIGGPAPAAATPKPVTASDRAVYVAANVARAQRCGFYFDPEQIKTNYIASEQQAGTAPDAMPRLIKEYDVTRQAVLAATANDAGYCTEGRTREVKATLTRQLAGDFNPPQKRQDLAVGWFDHQKKTAPLDGNKIFDASQKKQGPIGGDGL